MTKPILTKMVGLETTSQIWQRLSTYFASHTRVKIKKLKCQLKIPKKEPSVHTYLLDIKNIIDSLAVVGSPISTEDHIDVILDGLPEEYDHFVTSIISRLNPYIVDEIETLLLAQEERLEKHKFP